MGSAASSPSPLACFRKMWTPQLNAVLGSIVVTVGFWMTWGELPLAGAVALALGVTGFLAWRGSSITAVWAWTTLLLGMESLSWPLITMMRVRQSGAEPTEEQMGQILTAVLFGLFSAIFWITFAYGLFRKLGKDGEAAAAVGARPDATKGER